MKKTDEIKERIIESSIALIQSSEGNIEGISMRAIAEKAGVGTGLINYHFQTKENLIELCIGRMIGNVISGFRPELSPEARTPAARLKCIAKLVADFLVDNPAVSRISILSDLKSPGQSDNTMRSAAGFFRATDGLALPERERFLMSFALTSAIQTLFLRRDQSKALFGYDINNKERRDDVLDLLIDSLFGGFEHE